MDLLSIPTLYEFKQSVFLSLGTLKSVAYETRDNSEMDLIERIIHADAYIQENLGVFDRVRHTMVRRSNACIDSTG